jgi:carbon-monoxide dehydrogenase medium subunit
MVPAVAAPREPRVTAAATVDEAVGELARLDGEGAPMAGGTWIMRASLRGEAHRAHYVLLRDVAELSRISNGATCRIGALATHSDIGALGAGTGPLGALAEAARRSAFPAIRNVATLGGNLGAAPFPEADLVPALLAVDATVQLASAEGRTTMDVASYLRSRAARPNGELITGVDIPAPAGRRSWFGRLTVRNGGEYAIASVAVSLDVGPGGEVHEARVAVGGIDDVARRVGPAEDVLRGREPDGVAGMAAGDAAALVLPARDGLDAPAWYRLAVLPHLLGRVVARLGATGKG